MKLTNVFLQQIWRKLTGVPRSPDEISDKWTGVLNVTPILAWNHILNQVEPPLVNFGRLYVTHATASTRITTNTTTTLSSTSLFIVYGYVVNTANASAILTFRDSAGNTLFIVSAASLGIFILPYVGLIKDVVSSGGAAIDASVIGFDASAQAVTALLTGA